MPIKPENKDRYPANWRDVRESIMERARDEDKSSTAGIIYPHRCECVGECGRHEGRCVRRHGQAIDFYRDTWVWLTVAHLDHTPENCEPDNLRAMCQRCHLAYDAPRKKADRLRRQAEGTAPLF